MESMRIDFAQASLAFSGDRRALEDPASWLSNVAVHVTVAPQANALTSLSQKFQRASERLLRGAFTWLATLSRLS
jgi:hypothetical protein